MKQPQDSRKTTVTFEIEGYPICRVYAGIKIVGGPQDGLLTERVLLPDRQGNAVLDLVRGLLT